MVHCRFEIVPYSHLLASGIEKIAPTLRYFHETDDPEAQVLVEAVLDVVQPDPERASHLHWETFLKTGLHKVVVDILCEDKTYAPAMNEVCTGDLIRHRKLFNLLPWKGLSYLDVRTSSALWRISIGSAVYQHRRPTDTCMGRRSTRSSSQVMGAYMEE